MGFFNRLMCLVVLLLGASQALAQEPSADERIRNLEAQLEQQRVLLEQMQRELDRLKTESGTPAATADTVVASDAAAETEPQVAGGPEADFRPSMEISGFVNLDMIYDFDRVAPQYESTLVPTTIPTTPGLYGSDGNFITSIKQSRLSFVSEASTPLGDARGWIEFDLFGTGSNAGSNAFNLRHAWFELGRWGAGQTWSTFMDITTWPNVYDWWGPSGMALNRNPMVRYTIPYGEGGSHFAIALEQQNASFNVGIINELAPTLAEDLVPKSELPDLIGRWRTEGDWGHFQAAAVARHLAWETLESADNRPKGDTFGWGVNLTGILNTVGRDQLKFGVTYGEGIASFINDGGGSNLAPEFTGAGAEVKAMESLGFLLYYDHYWSEHWSSSIGLSQNDNKLTNLQLTSEPDKVTYASTNLFYTHSPAFVTGVEFLYGKLENADGSNGDDFRVQFTTRYNFAHKYSSR